MQFLIASTFQDSLVRLQPGEQSAAKIAAIEMQMNPAHPGLQMHRLDRAKDRNFWSARVSDDLRLILHRTETSCLLCYVDHHDPAYAWAERRKLTVHPTTGAAQMVVLKETVQQIIVREYVSEARPKSAKLLPLLANANPGRTAWVWHSRRLAGCCTAGNGRERTGYCDRAARRGA